MTLYNTLAILLTLSALFSYINHRVFKLPTTIGLMLMALLSSLVLICMNQFEAQLGFSIRSTVDGMIGSIDFSKTLLHGMLSYLLFAGALHVNLQELKKFKWVIAMMATLGVVVSTVIVGLLTWWFTGILGFNIGLLYCFIFGALISPTDPIAVIGILKNINAPKQLEAKIAGESLFNDGVGVVVFLALLSAIPLAGADPVTAMSIAKLFIMEAVGGVFFGLGIGALAYYMLRSIDNYSVEILITLALVAGGYALATQLHISGPIAIVVAGLIIGNHGRANAMSEKTRTHLDMFWELMDEVLNAVLFVLIGFEVLLLTLTTNYLLAGAVAIPVVLLARFVSVSIPVLLFRRLRDFSPKTIRILTWGGLRGGISVALALSLAKDGTEARALILTMTYMVVVFSILIQGLTIGRLVKSVKIN